MYKYFPIRTQNRSTDTFSILIITLSFNHHNLNTVLSESLLHESDHNLPRSLRCLLLISHARHSHRVSIWINSNIRIPAKNCKKLLRCRIFNSKAICNFFRREIQIFKMAYGVQWMHGGRIHARWIASPPCARSSLRRSQWSMQNLFFYLFKYNNNLILADVRVGLAVVRLKEGRDQRSIIYSFSFPLKYQLHSFFSERWGEHFNKIRANEKYVIPITHLHSSLHCSKGSIRNGLESAVEGDGRPELFLSF